MTSVLSGAGQGAVNGGILAFNATFTQDVTFGARGRILQLGQSQGYTGTVAGFSAAGGTLLDLRDIGFVKTTEATFSGTAMSGVLTVSDGTHTAHIDLKGNYLGPTFVASSDGHGGTTVVDPRATATAAHRLIVVAAGLGGMVG